MVVDGAMDLSATFVIDVDFDTSINDVDGVNNKGSAQVHGAG